MIELHDTIVYYDNYTKSFQTDTIFRKERYSGDANCYRTLSDDYIVDYEIAGVIRDSKFILNPLYIEHQKEVIAEAEMKLNLLTEKYLS